MKQYRRKILIGMADPGDRKPIRKSLNASERQRGKKEIKEQLTPESIQWREAYIKECYHNNKQKMRGFIHCLYRLNISLYDESNPYWDLDEDFIEKLLPPPEGWTWWERTIEKD